MSRQQRTRAFSLRSYPYAEADRVVVFLTEDEGVLRGVAKGSRKMQSRIAGSLEPLALVSLMYVEKPGRELAVVTGCEAERSLYGLPWNIERATTVGLVVELTLAFCAERDPSPAQFRLLDLLQRALLAGVNPGLAARYAELFTLKLAGLLPLLTEVRDRGARDLMLRLLRTNLLDRRLGRVERGDLHHLGTFLRGRIVSALGRGLKAYRFLDQIGNAKPSVETRSD